MAWKHLTTQFAATSQVRPEDLPEVAQHFGLLINNRPDAEEAGQPSSAELRAEAERLGIRYRHVPVTMNGIDDASIEAFLHELEAEQRPILAFCRTGTRSAALWALGQAPVYGAEAVLKMAAGAGYDLSGLSPRFQHAESA